ncbi:ankyrin-3-like [Haliotis asinina]|uniref:ankyrin-3-like n=1 Tax=Haliotis asinina TaxID=109174 RepID=UPI0035318F04
MDGDVNRAKFILSDSRSKINVRDPQRKTPVMIAAEKADIDMFAFLVRNGADLSPVDSKGNTILHLACEGGNLEIINNVIKQNTVDINGRGEHGRTPAMKAALQGHKGVFDLLARKGTDLSFIDLLHNTILHLACEGGNMDIVKYILKQNIVNINSMGEKGWTPAMKAALKGHKDVFNLIVKEGADLSLVDKEGDNILHAACKGGNVKIVKYILEQRSADINLRGKDMFTPVLIAAYRGHKDIFHELEKKSADLLIRDGNQNSILHLACKGGNIEIMKHILTTYSMIVNDIDFEGLTPIMLAASEGRKDMFDVLLQNGADFSHEDYSRYNILHMACRGGNVELVEHVLAQNIVEINSRSNDGSSPAMEAAYEGHTNVLELLRNEGADMTFVSDENDSILHAALDSKHMDTVKYVLTNDFVDIDSRNNNGITAVMLAVQGGLAEIFDLMVRKGANMSFVNDDKQTILHMACEEGHSEIVKYIIRENVVNINGRDDEGKTPVLLAAEQGYLDIVILLEGKGADLSVVDDWGENILHMLTVEGQLNLAIYLLTQKNVVQNINKKSLTGRTPVMVAALCGQRDLFDILVKYGADLTLVDTDGNSILHLACEGTVDIVKYLLSNTVVDINARGHLNRTPVLIAAEWGNIETFELLMKQGADMLLVDDDGNGVLLLAVRGGNVDLVQHILVNRIVDITAKNKYGLNAIEIAKESNHNSVYNSLLSPDFRLK